ncbi:MAG: hypothetical protein ACC645_08900 [Pirellulales bacterium]
MQLESLVPDEGDACRATRSRQIADVAGRIERHLDRLALFEGVQSSAELVDRAEELVSFKGRIDRQLDRALAVRAAVAGLPAGPDRRDRARHFLRIVSTLVDLSGRIRYRLYDALYDVAFELASLPAQRERLIDMLRRDRSSIGAAVMAEALFDPPRGNPNGALPAGMETKRKLLELVAVTGQRDVLPMVSQFALDRETPPSLRIEAARTIRQIGLPQTPRPGQDPTLPVPPITARPLLATLRAIADAELSPADRRRRDGLIDWLTARMRRGLSDADGLKLGTTLIRPGDWLLMRNPSPYNHFTNLSPGLFTHVGVVTLERGTDGIGRMVLVDLPEQGKTMRTTNVDLFVERTLHYAFLRDRDPQVARTMARRANDTIGVATQFDLNFRTDRVDALKGLPLDGRKIHTYCAGLLLLCAQETSTSRREFFPLPECVAGGHTAENLAKLGMSVGNDFISPSGALFSPRLKVVGRRDPMYEPQREVEEALYDHFAARLIHDRLTPTPDAIQQLRLRLARSARTNRLLARALADAAGVDRETDLVAAAKALVVIETLDQVATGSSRQFQQAWEAVRAGTRQELTTAGLTPAEMDQIEANRRGHAELWRRWLAEKISPRQLRMSLVQYYVRTGKRRLDSRFFPATMARPSPRGPGQPSVAKVPGIQQGHP